MGGFKEQIEAVKGPEGLAFTNLGEVVSKVLTYSLTIGGIALLLYFLYGGFQLFTSGGDQKKVAEGKATITNALIGFVIVFVAFWIVQLFGSLLGINTILK